MPVPRRALGPSAEFRDGQLAATRATWNSAAVFWSCNIPAGALIEQELLGPLLYRAPEIDSVGSERGAMAKP